MKIKRFFAQDIRHAINEVRTTLGADAVILSNRQVDGGVEIVAAIDYDEEAVNSAANRASEDKHPSMQMPRIQTPNHALKQELTTPFDDNKTNKIKKNPFPSATKGDNLELGTNDSRKNAKKQTKLNDNQLSAMQAYTSQQTQVSDDLINPIKQEKTSGHKTKSPNSDIVWSQDPAIKEMRTEMEFLRKLMENQLSGMVWGNFLQHDPERVELIKKLTCLGLNPKLVKILADRALSDTNASNAWKRSLNYLAKMLPIHDNEILEHGGVIAMVGPTGVGKTTTIAKLAARFAMTYGSHSVALVTTDCYRIGAHEQLMNYGRILDVPVRVASNAEELKEVLYTFSDKKLVLIDTAGMGQRDMRLTEQLSILNTGNTPIRTYLVLSASTHANAIGETIKAFSKIEPVACILTKVDESASLGGALSETIRNRLPIAYITDGQRVPEDLHLARAHSLINRSAATMDETNNEVQEEALAMTFGGMALHAST